jgi:hypothetical protein
LLPMAVCQSFINRLNHCHREQAPSHIGSSLYQKLCLPDLQAL